MSDRRLRDVIRFYSILNELEKTIGGARDGHKFPTWGEGRSAAKDIKVAEIELERVVSEVIRAMPFIWLSVDDEPGPASVRGKIERNAIALLSNFNEPLLDSPSPHWLGRRCDRVRASGL
jgi:hypothetical protein